MKILRLIDCGKSWVAQSTEELLLLSQRLSKPFLTFPAGCKRGSAPTCPGSRRQLCSTEHRADPNPDQSSSATNNHSYSKCEFLVSSYCDFQVAALLLSSLTSTFKHSFWNQTWFLFQALSVDHLSNQIPTDSLISTPGGMLGGPSVSMVTLLALRSWLISSLVAYFSDLRTERLGTRVCDICIELHLRLSQLDTWSISWGRSIRTRTFKHVWLVIGHWLNPFFDQVASTPVSATIATPSPSPSTPSTPIAAMSPVKQTPRVRNPASSNRAPLIVDERLPSGWHRKVSQRKSGASIGRYEVFIISPVSFPASYKWKILRWSHNFSPPVAQHVEILFDKYRWRWLKVKAMEWRQQQYFSCLKCIKNQLEKESKALPTFKFAIFLSKCLLN